MQKTYFLILLITFSLLTYAEHRNDTALFNKAYAHYKKKNYKKALEIISHERANQNSESLGQLVIKGLVLNDSISFEIGAKYCLEAEVKLTIKVIYAIK